MQSTISEVFEIVFDHLLLNKYIKLEEFDPQVYNYFGLNYSAFLTKYSELEDVQMNEDDLFPVDEDNINVVFDDDSNLNYLDQKLNLLKDDNFVGLNYTRSENDVDLNEETNSLIDFNLEETVCESCKKDKNEEFLLLCDNKNCNYAYHTFCIGLGTIIPEGDWYCLKCNDEFMRPKKKKIIIESDSE